MADERPSWGKRWLWFVGLWVAGVGLVSIVAFAIRSLIL